LHHTGLHFCGLSAYPAKDKAIFGSDFVVPAHDLY
jgi:hypothetical protein